MSRYMISDLQNFMRLRLFDLYDQEGDLVHNFAGERCLVHLLAVRLLEHLDRLDNAFSVDVEYNKMGRGPHVPKRSGARLMTPDVIVHKRGTSDPTANLLAVEVKNKPRPDSRAKDVEKVRSYLKSPNLLYQFGAYIESNRDRPKWAWFDSPQSELFMEDVSWDVPAIQ